MSLSIFWWWTSDVGAHSSALNWFVLTDGAILTKRKGTTWPRQLLGDRLPNDLSMSAGAAAAVMTARHALVHPAEVATGLSGTTLITERPPRLRHLGIAASVSGDGGGVDEEAAGGLSGTIPQQQHKKHPDDTKR